MENKKDSKKFKIGQPEEITEKLIMKLLASYMITTQSFFCENKDEGEKCNFLDILVAASMSHLFRIFEFVNHSIKNCDSENFKSDFKNLLNHYLKQSELL